MREMTEYLLALGHTDIAYVSPIITTKLSHSAEARALGFHDACDGAGTPIRARELFFDERSDHPMERMAGQLVSLGPDMPTALCCYADMCALPLAFALARHGIAVPERVSLTGFDDATYAEQYGLTTMRQDPRELGEIAARKALDLIDGDAPDEPHGLADLQLIPRLTTGPLAR